MVFPSKTKLFTHVREAGHAAPLSEVKGQARIERRGKKGR
jgi:hypothetical protein